MEVFATHCEGLAGEVAAVGDEGYSTDHRVEEVLEQRPMRDNHVVEYSGDHINELDFLEVEERDSEAQRSE